MAGGEEFRWTAGRCILLLVYRLMYHHIPRQVVWKLGPRGARGLREKEEEDKDKDMGHGYARQRMKRSVTRPRCIKAAQVARSKVVGD